jgi:hypothetical protein
MRRILRNKVASVSAGALLTAGAAAVLVPNTAQADVPCWDGSLGCHNLAVLGRSVPANVARLQIDTWNGSQWYSWGALDVTPEQDLRTEYDFYNNVEMRIRCYGGGNEQIGLAEGGRTTPEDNADTYWWLNVGNLCERGHN